MIPEMQRRWPNLPRLVRIAVTMLLLWGMLLLSTHISSGANLHSDGRRVSIASWTFIAHAVLTFGPFWLCSTVALWMAPRWTTGGTVHWRSVVGWTCVFGCAWSLEGMWSQSSLIAALRFFVTTTPLWMVQAGGFVAAGLVWQLWGQAAERERELQQAQLRALRSQLQPHFLFNTLHAIGVTATHDGATASRMTTLLGDLLRHSLRERTSPLVPLADEVELLQPYLQLQQLRFADRMRVQIDVPPSLQEAMVPDLLLQPLVENALQHGIEQRPGAGEVHIRAARAGDCLLLEVRDDGVPVDATVHEGTGLQATRQRLQTLFGYRASLTLAPNPQGGTTATIRLPFTEARHAA